MKACRRSRPLRSLAPLLLLAATGAISTPAPAAPALFPGYFEALHLGLSGFAWYPTIGDLDLDGRDDLVCLVDGGLGRQVLSVRFGEAGGGLSEFPTLLPVPASVTVFSEAWPCIGDLDGDGTPDLVAGAISELVVIRGLGARQFAPYVRIPDACTGHVPAADLNGDGLPDYACLYRAPAGPDIVRIRFGTGGLAFTPGPSFAAGSWASGVQLRDFDGDGVPDVFVGADRATVLLNDGAGGFVPRVVAASLAFPAGDLNGDGFEDLANRDSTFLNNGDGTFRAGVPHGVREAEAAFDLNGDGRPDLVGRTFVDHDGQFVTVGLSRGDGTCTSEATYRSTPSMGALDHGDFDQDGHEDLVAPAWDQNFVVILHGNGGGGFRQGVQTFAAGHSGALALPDLNGDGNPDLVVASAVGETLEVRLSTGPMAYGPPVDYPVLLPVSTIAAGDLDGDGREDLVAGYTSLRILSAWITQPDGTLGPRTDILYPGPAAMLRLARIDGDTLLDVVVGGPSTQWWAPGHGDGTFGAPVILPASLTLAKSFDVIDLDDDGDQDLVAGGQGNGARVMLASGPGVFAGYTDYPGLQPPNFAAAGSFDGDGLPDVVVASDTLWLYPGIGGGALGPRVRLGVNAGAPALACDLDGDGRTDVVGPSSGSQLLRVHRWHSPGNLTMLTYGIRHSGAGPGSVAVADMDGNGARDLVVSESTMGSPVVSVLLNQAPPTLVDVPAPAVRRGSRLAVRAVPNPAHGLVALRLAAAGAGPVEIELFDLNGRRVSATRVARATTAGVPLPGTHRLAPGVYLVRARQGDASATARVCVMR